jgi:hypothetical protein
LYKRFLLVPLILAFAASPALAGPTVIAALGESPLLGPSASTAQMRARVAANEGIVSAAAAKIGLTPSEFAQLRAAIDSSRVAWVTVPRHLDAMSWQSGGTVYVLHDVIIPAATHGWEVDIPEQGHILALYLPAACGNLSIVRKVASPLALRSHPTRVAALHYPPDVPTMTDSSAYVAPAAPVVIPDDAPAAPVTVASTEFPPVAPAATHHLLFLVPLLAIAAAISGGTGSGPVAAAPTGCP